MTHIRKVYKYLKSVYNMYKKALFTIPIFLVLSLSLASAFSFSDIFESFTFSEDIQGENRGFSVTYSTNLPKQNSISGCNYYDWTSDGRKCKKTLSHTNQRAIDFSNDAYFDARHSYNRDKAYDNAFRTFQRDSQLQLQNERARERERNRNRYSNFGYSYGYRPYSSYYYW
jgi:hypothetical protein